MFHFLDGGNQLMMAILLLVLVWALSSLARDLGLAEFVAATIGFLIPRWLVPAAVFAAGAALAYFIGSSWGAWGILMPLAVSIAVATGASLPATVGAVFASGCFGDFTSPLGETTITTSAVFNLPAVAYARAKLPSSLVAAILATLAFVIVGLRA
jgi:Na+/H+ antiporter NhaC